MIMKIKSINILAVCLSFFMMFNIISSNIVYASTCDNDDQSVEFLAQELEFYFSKVGYVNENNQYVITNPELLKERVDDGDGSAEKLYNAYLLKQDSENGLLSRGYVDYGKCVLKSYLGPIYDLMDGKYAKALAEQMMSDSWHAAGQILKMALKDASKIAGKTVGGAFAIGELAYYAYQCRGEY